MLFISCNRLSNNGPIFDIKTITFFLFLRQNLQELQVAASQMWWSDTFLCFTWYYMLGFGLLVGKSKTSEEVTLDLKLWTDNKYCTLLVSPEPLNPGKLWRQHKVCISCKRQRDRCRIDLKPNLIKKGLRLLWADCFGVDCRASMSNWVS